MESRWVILLTLREIIQQREKRMVPENSSMAPEKLTSLKLFIDYSASYRENPD